jgi:uncharacterized protein (TIGR00251 family)
MTSDRSASACYRWDGDRLFLHIRLQPRASGDAIAGIHGNALKVRITAPPVEGRANDHLIRYLAEVFAVPRARIQLVSGLTSRDKHLIIQSPGRLPPPISRP